MWYIGRMVKRHAQDIKHLLKCITVSIIVMGMAGLGTLQAGQVNCKPECSLHQPEMLQASCCMPSGTSHVKLLSGDLQEKHHVPSSDCDGTLCADSSFEVIEIAACLSSPMDMSSTPRHAYLSETTAFLSSKKSFGQPYFADKKIPIYMLTCVYLI